MSARSMPYVAIVGGFYNLDPAEAVEAKRMAREIGSALAKAGMGLVVYFSNEHSLEPHVVNGYVQAVPAGEGGRSICIRFAKPQKDQVRFAEETTRPELFERNLFPGDDWEAPFYRSLVAAESVDAVLLVAGGRSTLIAGQIAMARPLPILAIDRFAGSAGDIWTELAHRFTDYPSSSIHSVEKLAGWLKASCLRESQKQAENRLIASNYGKIVSQRRKSFWAACAFLALMCIVISGVSLAPPVNIYPFLMFAGLIAAGATGSTIRAVIWGSETTAPGTSLLLGGVAGFVVGLAYLIPQWIGAPGVLAPSTTFIGSTEKIQFVSAILVAISAGVGFDTVFSRLKKQAEDQPIGAPLQK